MLCDSCSASFCWWNQNTAFCTQHLRNLPYPVVTFCDEPVNANRQYHLQYGKGCLTASRPAKFARKATDSNLTKPVVNYRFCPPLIRQWLKASKTAQQVISFQTAPGACLWNRVFAPLTSGWGDVWMDGRMEEFVHLCGCVCVLMGLGWFRYGFADVLKNMSAGLPNLWDTARHSPSSCCCRRTCCWASWLESSA